MRKIGILSPSGTGNLGDEATVAVLIAEVRRRYPSSEIYGLTTNPADTLERHGVPAYPARNLAGSTVYRKPAGHENELNGNPNGALTVRDGIKRMLKRLPFIYRSLKTIGMICAVSVNSIAELRFIGTSLKRMNGTDLLIVAGSGQLCDNFYGAWGFPYTLLKWSVIAKACRTKLAFLSCGAGPIDSHLSKLFIKWALRLADYRSFRDRESKELIEKLGINANDPVFPDLVFSSKLRGNGNSQAGLIAINPFPHYDYRYWPESSPTAYSSYLNRLASVVSWLIKKGYTVLLFPTQLRADPLVIEDLKAILMKDGNLDLEKYLLVQATANLDDLIAQISMATMVVASRFHGVLMSFLLEKPVLALSHHPKVDNLMRDMGQADYLLDIDTFDLPAVIDRFAALESKIDIVGRQIKSNLTVQQRRLESQYDDLFGMWERAGGGIESVPSKNPVPN